MQKHYFLSENDRKALVAYLGTRPYNEVAGAIAALMQLPEAPTPAPSPAQANVSQDAE